MMQVVCDSDNAMHVMWTTPFAAYPQPTEFTRLLLQHHPPCPGHPTPEDKHTAAYDNSRHHSLWAPIVSDRKPSSQPLTYHT